MKSWKKVVEALNKPISIDSILGRESKRWVINIGHPLDVRTNGEIMRIKGMDYFHAGHLGFSGSERRARKVKKTVDRIIGKTYPDYIGCEYNQA